ncbi:cytochrome P450 4C1-like [Centruroides sculpturatus]|uniref:cytochrome P450 4C1-like n=1 Tax=Centruroides sculpturatus TaxID=218467 RepID=UPI000C6E87E3|nr:cytochrome P450 4C1-like [Centruroides sculpturatus]
MSIPETQTWWTSTPFFIVISLILLVPIVILFINTLYGRNSTYDKIPGRGENHFLYYLKFLYSLIATGRLSTESVLNYLNLLLKIHRKSGICLLNLPFSRVVFLYRPDLVKVLLGNTENNCRSVIYSFMEEWLSSSLLLRDGEEWKQRRKLLTPAFHFQILENFLPIMEKHSEMLIKTLKNYQKEEWIDIVPFVTRSVMDIICETAMGIEGNTYDYDYSQYQRSLSRICNIIQMRAWQPYLWSKYIFHLTKNRRELSKNIKILKEITDKIIENKLKRSRENSTENIKEKRVKKLAFLDLLLDYLKRDSNFTIEDACKEVQLFLFGGHDTTSVTISWTLYLLGKHLNVQDKVRKEVEDVIGNDWSRHITKEDMQRMKYLEAVIRETLRLYPTVPLLTRNLTKDIVVDNYKISRGSMCIIPIYFMHKNPKLFPNPKVFDPDRFLPENITKIIPYSYIPFSAGPRNCIGQKFAMMEMKILLSNIVRCFNLRSLDESVPVSIKVVSHPERKIRIKLMPRRGDVLSD